MKNKIVDLYINKRKSSIQIAKELGLSKGTILNVLKRTNTKRRSISIAGRIHAVNEKYFEKIDNEQKAYWLGFIAADGCVFRKKNGWQSTLRIGLSNTDKNQLVQFKKDIESSHPINNVRFNGVAFAIYSKKIINDLIKLNITQKKSLTLEAPNIKGKLIRHFIRGYFDGDGCICKRIECGKNKNTIGISIEILGTKNILYFIQKNMNFIKTSIGINKKIPRIRFYSSKKEKIYLIYKYFYSEATRYLDRKKKKFEEVI